VVKKPESEQTAPPVPATESSDLVRVENLRKYFPVQTGFLASLLNRGHVPSVKAVDGVSFTIKRGEVLVWRARAVRENQPSGAWCCASMNPPPAR